ncbi:MAG: DUF892 family protein [Rhodomicrobium sp.]
MSLFGNLAAVGHAVARDEILKNSLANFAFENYEIATYKSLIQVAEETGYQAAEEPLEQSLAEEEAMADWFNQRLAGVTSTYLRREISGQPPPLSIGTLSWRLSVSML